MKEISAPQAKRILVEILQEFHQFCHRENLRYSLYAGSLIGALRHQGFIPWDDDIDVLMPGKIMNGCFIFTTLLRIRLIWN